MKENGDTSVRKFIDEAARADGFKDFDELLKLHNSVNTSTPERLKALRDWRKYDGSKRGLLNLLDGQPPAAPPLTPEALALIIDRSGLNTSQFAKELGVNRDLIQKIKAGNRPITKDLSAKVRERFAQHL